MIILVILIILIAIICGILAYQRVDREGFDLGPNTELSTCPLQSKAYLAKNGDTLCCEGSLSPEGDCTKPLCALAARKDMPSCKAMLDAANQKLASSCPPSLPNYYTDGKAVTGCTDGALNNERTGPISMFSKTCKVYPNTPIKINGKMTSYTLNDTKEDSCSVQRRLEITKKDMKTLFGANFMDVMKVNINVILFYTSFIIPGSTTPAMCETKENLIYNAKRMSLDGNQIFNTEAGRKAYIESINQGLQFDCTTAKAIHIDKSTTVAEIAKKINVFRVKHPEWTSV